MEKYREKIRKSVISGRVLVGIAAVIVFVINYLDFKGIISEYVQNDSILAFQSGLLVGIALAAIVTIAKYNKALRNEDDLRHLYNEEHDERLILIRQKSGMPIIAINSIVILFIGIIAGYFNMTVFICLITVAVVQMVVSVVVKFYYMKTM